VQKSGGEHEKDDGVASGFELHIFLLWVWAH